MNWKFGSAVNTFVKTTVSKTTISKTVGLTVSTLVALLPIASAPWAGGRSAQAATFGQLAVNQNDFVVLAAPRGNTGLYNLLILEQIPGKRACWRENNDADRTVDPLLLNFDFTGICRRYTDSNSFSVRMGGEDLGLKYTLRLVNRGDQVLLVGTSFDRNLPELVLGRTQGRSDRFLEIQLDPNWKLAKRTYNGVPLGHVYLASNLTLSQVATQPPTPTPTPTPAPTPTPTPQPTPPAVKPPNPPTQLPTERPTPPSGQPTPPVVERPDPPIATNPTAPKPPIIPSPSTNPENPQNSQEVAIQQAYREILEREADPQSVAYYLAQLNQGKTIADIRTELKNTEEGRTLAIKRAYLEVLGREADPAGLAAYLEQMDLGASIADIRQDLARSREGRTWAIRQAYQDILRREPDPASLQAYLERLRRGLSVEALREELRQSPEAQRLRSR